MKTLIIFSLVLLQGQAQANAFVDSQAIGQAVVESKVALDQFAEDIRNLDLGAETRKLDQKLTKAQTEIILRTLQLVRWDMQGVRFIADDYQSGLAVVGTNTLAYASIGTSVVSGSAALIYYFRYIFGVLGSPFFHERVYGIGVAAPASRPNLVYELSRYTQNNRGLPAPTNRPKYIQSVMGLRLQRIQQYLFVPSQAFENSNLFVRGVVLPINGSANILYRSIMMLPKLVAPLAATGVAIVAGSTGYALVLSKEKYDHFMKNLEEDIAIAEAKLATMK